MNEKEMLAAVKKAANVPADGWGVTWNPLYNPGHCAELIATYKVCVVWYDDKVSARTVKCLGDSAIESFGPTLSTPHQAMRRAVCRAVIGGAS